MAALKFTQPQINVLRGLLSQDGWAKDFGDFWDAGKALSEWPKEKFLAQDSNTEQIDAMMKETHSFEIDEKTKAVISKALKHYVAKGGSPTGMHFEVMRLLGIERL